MQRDQIVTDLWFYLPLGKTCMVLFQKPPVLPGRVIIGELVSEPDYCSARKIKLLL